MPKKQVVEFECDRCGRKWYDDTKADTPALTLKLYSADGDVIEEVEYTVLCEPCSSTCMNYVGSITKDLKKQSPKRGAKEEEEEAPSPPRARRASGGGTASSQGPA